jgi:hypothetical protein
METSDQLWQLLRSLLQQLPSTLTIIGCIVFAVSRYRRHPGVSLFAILALIFLLLHAIIFAAVYVWVPNLLIREGAGTSSFRGTMLVLGLIYNSTLALGFGLLLVAIFMRRDKVPASS